jgi:iron complex outermembrane receptor protein
LSPNGQVDSSSGFDEYEQRQADATLTGVEIDLQDAVTEHIVLHGGFDMVQGKNDETENWLPLIPARRFQAGVQYLQPALFFLNNARIWLTARAVLDQDNVDPFESPTGGYTLYDAGIGGEIPFGGRQVLADFVVQNMFNKAYFDHLSRYKDYALNPGVNFALKFTVPFTIIE